MAISPQPRERLAFLLWPASSESQARTNLRQLLHNLKRALPPECDCLETDHFTVQWRKDASWTVDIIEFQTAIAGSEAARQELDRARECNRLKPPRNFMKTTFCPRSTTTG